MNKVTRTYIVSSYRLLMVFLIFAVFGTGQILRAQQTQENPPNPHSFPSGNSNQEEETARPIQSLTIRFRNGTPGHSSIKGVTAHLFPRDKISDIARVLQEKGTLAGKDKEKIVELTINEKGVATADLKGRNLKHPVLYVTYKGGFYTKVLHGSENKEIDFTVYEPTRDKSVLKLQRHHIPIEPSENVLLVSEVLILTNTSKRAFVGPEGPATLNFTVPEGVKQVLLDSGGGGWQRQDVGNSGRVRMVRSVVPGRPQQVLLRYQIPIRDNTAVLERNVDFSTSIFRLVMKEGDYKLESNLPVQRNNTKGSTRVAIVKGDDLEKGETIRINFSRPGSASGNSEGDAGMSRDIILLFIGIAAGLALLFNGYMIYSHHTSEPGEVTSTEEDKGKPSSSPTPNKEVRNILMEEIARLDEALEEGEIDQPYHEKTRQRLKTKLLDLENRTDEQSK